MKRVHVMVAVLRDVDGRVLVNQRPAGKMQAGRWEFPGGKLEEGETREAGLRRELREELGISLQSATPLIRIRHDYPHLHVLLDVFEIEDWRGEPAGLEGQALKWVEPDALLNEDILEADFPIIQAIRLPRHLLITPEPSTTPDFLDGLERSLQSGVKLVQLRAHDTPDAEYIALARQALPIVHAYDARLVLNRGSAIAADIPADGIHVSSSQLQGGFERGEWQWVSAACHSREELERASDLGVDFALLSPVAPTASHTDADPLGWPRFAELVDGMNMPVYALGGMQDSDDVTARAHGGQGIAAIRGLWKGR